MTSEPFPPYHDLLPQITSDFAERGSIGLVVADLSTFAAIQDEYGTQAYDEVRQRMFTILKEQKGKDYRIDDRICLDQPKGLRLMIFMGPKRRKALALTPADAKAARARYVTGLIAAIERAAFPYLHSSRHVNTGYAMAIYNPLVHPEHIVSRAFRQALQTGTHLRQADDLQAQEKLYDLLARERLVTAYQAIYRLADRSLLGYEALSRGSRGTGLETADLLFGTAGRFNLLPELDRLCRKRALLSSSRIPSTCRVFVNALPSTIREPEFRGKPLIDFLELAQVAPNRIVIEITEKLVIENYSLFREAMDYYSDLGMSFAVDDVGAGYSGLESISRLKPQFLKIDISLVRDIHSSSVNREMVKAITQMGNGIGASVIAEGITTDEELAVLGALNVEYGQGFLLGRPELPRE